MRFVIQPGMFSIGLGFAGATALWRLASVTVHAPAAIADVLAVIAFVVWLATGIGWVATLQLEDHRLMDQAHHEVLGPALAVFPFCGGLLAVALVPHAAVAGRTLIVLFGAATLLAGAALVWVWVADRVRLRSLHPGYFLPVVAGPLLTAQGFEARGWHTPAVVLLVVGTAAWVLLAPLVLGRLVKGPPLPLVQRPILALEIAAPALIGNTYLIVIARFDAGAAFILAVTVVMLLVQFALLPRYRQVPFGPSTWSYSFSTTTVGALAVRWIAHEQPPACRVLIWIVLIVASAMPVTLTAFTLRAIRRGAFFERVPAG